MAAMSQAGTRSPFLPSCAQHTGRHVGRVLGFVRFGGKGCFVAKETSTLGILEVLNILFKGRLSCLPGSPLHGSL